MKIFDEVLDMEGQYIIFAPHADDEVIGCYEILQQKKVGLVVFDNLEHVHEALKCSEHFKFSVMDMEAFIKLLIDHKMQRCEGLFVPDPHFELHPLHKDFAALPSLLNEFNHSPIPVYYYSTNMNTPYLREVKDSVGKLAALNKFYPQKKSLWEYDHKYFLFESQILKCQSQSWKAD